MRKNVVKSVLLTSVIWLGAASASAAFINGNISMSGDYEATGGTGLGDATGLDFLGDDFDVDTVDGDLAAFIAVGDIGFYQDFDFAPLNPNPVNPLWSVGGFSFSLEEVMVEFQDNSFLVLSGTGTLSGNGFDDTLGTWNLTANGLGTLFNFSSGAVATGVAEPGILLLLSVGVLGLAARRRRS